MTFFLFLNINEYYNMVDVGIENININMNRPFRYFDRGDVLRCLECNTTQIITNTELHNKNVFVNNALQLLNLNTTQRCSLNEYHN